jgi:hypothetical protein
MLQRGETTVGPVAVDGRTITMVARTRALHLGGAGRGALHVRARPVHVEVLDGDGRREVVRIHDLERALMAAIGVAGAVLVLGVRAARKTRGS